MFFVLLVRLAEKVTDSMFLICLSVQWKKLADAADAARQMVRYSRPVVGIFVQ